MTNRHTAWFTQQAETPAIIVDSESKFVEILPLPAPFEVDEWNPHIAKRFCIDALNAHYGIGRWLVDGDSVVDANSLSFGFVFIRQP